METRSRSVYVQASGGGTLLWLGSFRPGEHMTKVDLTDQVNALGDLTRRDSEVIVETLFDAVVGALKVGEKVEIRGFGSFRTRQRNSRTGRNPKTGASVSVPAKRVPFFKPSKELRELIVQGTSSLPESLDGSGDESEPEND